MSKISVSLDNRVVLKNLKGMPKVVQQALVSGINKTATQARNAGIKGITKRYTIKASRIKQNIKVTKRATRARIIATITATQGRVPGLQNFRARKRTRVGWSVMVQKGKRKIITGGFVSPGAKGKGIGLFVGTGTKVVPRRGFQKGRRLTRRSPWTASVSREAGQRIQREALDRLFGPSPTGMWRRRGRVKARRFVRDNIGRIVGAAIEFGLRRAIAKR